MTDLPPPPPPPRNMAPPPGYVAYGGPGAVTGGFEPIRSLTKWLGYLLIASAALQLVNVIVQFGLRNRAADYLDTQTIRFKDGLGVYVMVGLLAGVVALAQLVVLILWTIRLVRNHQRLLRTPQSFGIGASIAVNILGGCTLGIVNFFMWREIWKASDPTVPAGDPTWRQRSVSPLVAVYLGVTLAAVVASTTIGFTGAGFSFRFGGKTSDLAKMFNDKMPYIIVSGLLTVAGSIVLLVLSRQLAARHMQATNESAG